MPILVSSDSVNLALPVYSPSTLEKAIFALAGLTGWLGFDQASAPLFGLYSQDKLTAYNRARGLYPNPVTGTPATTTLDGRPAATFAGAQSIDVKDPQLGCGQVTITAGSGGLNGTYALPLPAPSAGGIQAVGTFTVSGGAVTSAQFSTTGTRYVFPINISNAQLVSAGATGLSGAAITVGQGGVLSTGDYTFAGLVTPSSFPLNVSSAVLGGKNPKYHSIHFSQTNGYLEVFHAATQVYSGAVANTTGVPLLLVISYKTAGGVLTIRKNGAQEARLTGITPNVDNTSVIGDIPALTGDRKLRADVATPLFFSRDLNDTPADLATVESYLAIV